jgi:transcription initiation factor TFIIIB Brf1 subunit/transcription initiation factor TFIIB
MSTKWCPNCHGEYREGFVVCADCGVPLVDSLPPRTEARPIAPTAPFLPGDDVVELATLGIVEAELVAAQLRVAGIPASVFGTGAVIYTGVRQARLMVRRSDLVEAEQFVAQLSAEERSGMPITDDDLVSLAEESEGGSDPATGAAV